MTVAGQERGPSHTALPFDSLAESYDDAFTRTQIGRRMRAAVWRRLDARFAPGARILEMNCGTGEDAVHLAGRGVRVLATDIAPEMVERAERKAIAFSLGDRIQTRRLAIENLDELGGDGPFDGALSNFGGLNCVNDLAGTAWRLAGLIRPGGVAVLCVMGPIVPWEWVWYGLQGRPGKALRRLKPGGVEWNGIVVRYPSVGALRKAFAPWFTSDRVIAIGALIPPPYAEDWVARRPRLLAALDRCERKWERFWPLPRFADHYLIELIRTDSPQDP